MASNLSSVEVAGFICVLIPQLSSHFHFICLSFLDYCSLQPGRNVKVGMCVWQGFIASAPGLSILADAIECRQPRSNIHHCWYGHKFCPNPDITVLLYCEVFTGPCRLEHRSTEFWSWRSEPVWAWRNYVVEWSAARSRPHNHITAKEKWACHSGKRK
jgi:hypothetical protein